MVADPENLGLLAELEAARAREHLARAEIADLRRRLGAAETSNARAIVEEALHAREAIENVERSLSWRITRPLRAARRLVTRPRP